MLIVLSQLEEAGVHGVLGPHLGNFEDKKKRTRTSLFSLLCTGERLMLSFGRFRLLIALFVSVSTEELETWEEGAKGRLRQWLDVREVDDVLKKKPANRVMWRLFVNSRADLRAVQSQLLRNGDSASRSAPAAATARATRAMTSRQRLPDSILLVLRLVLVA